MTFYEENRTLIFVGIGIIGLIIGFCIYWFYFKPEQLLFLKPSIKQVRFEQEQQPPPALSYLPKGTSLIPHKQLKKLPDFKPVLSQQGGSDEGRVSAIDATRKYQNPTSQDSEGETDDELADFFEKSEMGGTTEYLKEE